MLEESTMSTRLNTSCHLERNTLVDINNHVVRLIKQKVIPLNRAKYNHLQKISHALRKKQPGSYACLAHLTHHAGTYSHPTSPNSKQKFQRNGQAILTADLLINRLKSLKDLHLTNATLLKNQRVGECWQTLRNSINQTHPERYKHTSQFDSDECLKSRASKRKKENLLDLAERAEKYLRIKKHELKERYCQQEQERESKRRLQSTHCLPLKAVPQQRASNWQAGGEKEGSGERQLQRELLRDIRENMLEQKINRIKKDINHRKIVQMR